LKIQNNICKNHIKTNVANKYSIQCKATNHVITTAKAQVAPDIIPGLHPNIAVINHTIKAACNQTIGFIHATKEKAIASGINARATVKPDKISVFNCFLLDNSFNIHLLFRYVSSIIICLLNYIIHNLLFFNNK
jgi:hypothetical protein